MTTPWKDYAPDHAADKHGAKIAPPANRWLAILVCLAVVCAIVGVMM